MSPSQQQLLLLESGDDEVQSILVFPLKLIYLVLPKKVYSQAWESPTFGRISNAAIEMVVKMVLVLKVVIIMLVVIMIMMLVVVVILMTWWW